MCTILTGMSLVAKILNDKIIPWANHDLHERTIVARAEMDARLLPEGVALEPHKIAGERVIFKALRQYANTRTQVAEWPQAGLLETNNPKLACVISGRAVYQIHHFLLHAGVGNFIVLPPGTPHPIGYLPHVKDNIGFCELLNLQSYGSAVQCWICRSDNKKHSAPQRENYLLKSGKVARLFDLMMAESVECEPNSRELRKHITISFFMALQQEIAAGRYSHPCAQTAHEAPVRNPGDFAAQLYEYIQTHLNEPLTLELVSRQMHQSRTQFARKIKRETGKTFVEILTDCRIASAKTLLTDSDWTSTAIAEFVGFKSPSYFQTLFQEQTGQTPGKFRQTSRNEQKKESGTNSNSVVR